jgi:hypothetical protein
MFYIAILYLLIFKLFLAGKDASSYLLKDKSASGHLTNYRIKRWHRDGVAIDVMNTLSVAYIFGPAWWQVILISLLLRLAVFDLAFNKWAFLNINYLGSTAWADKLFVKIFGINGAIKKSLFFAITIVLYCIAKIIFKF